MTPKPKTVKHLVRRTSNEIGDATRYHAPCGYSGLNSRDFTKSLTDTTCEACLWVTNRPTKKGG